MRREVSKNTDGCFRKWWYPQNTSKWSFLVGKPMVVGYHHCRKPPDGDEVSTKFHNNSVSWYFQDVPIPCPRDMPVNLQFPKQTSRSGEVKAKTTGTSRCKRFPEYPDVQIQKKRWLVIFGDNPSKDIPKSNHEFTNGTSSYHFLATV